jgi:hypothetical protein
MLWKHNIIIFYPIQIIPQLLTRYFLFGVYKSYYLRFSTINILKAEILELPREGNWTGTKHKK